MKNVSGCLLLVVVLLTGCAQSGTWTHPSKSQSNFTQDDMNCAAYANNTALGLQSFTLSLIARKTAYSDCMKAQGWSQKGSESKDDVLERSDIHSLISHAWGLDLNLSNGAVLTNLMAFRPDGRYMSTIWTDDDSIVHTTKGDWSINGKELVMTVTFTDSEAFKVGDVSTYKIASLDDQVVSLENIEEGYSIAYYRLDSKNKTAYKSQQRLFPNSSSQSKNSIQSGTTILKPNAYGLGTHMDQYGRPVKIVPQ